ncbi:mitogen-activated protein kinase kinase kinase 17 [Punica granatum]|uniref:Protein kinase domain-containing protein n=2 Tax=Punica granatum TaxID=22663 RepID=A0A218XB37_PUNGR|nr:mitogen-activated protein kinase kinase kinase 17 [Punica granatum]OWM82167.1 hypothetical protein CDL15_Pgr001741 [Punica granatum]PKI39439.1 hypothetical protein CRG98_040197 [Punica granatum]
MEWIRGEEIGRGGFAWINLAIPNKNLAGLPPLIAVKSCDLSHSATLGNELEVLQSLGECPHVIRCFGAGQTIEGGSELFNLLLEYAPGGSLANEMRKRGGKLTEPEVRRHARSVLEALRHIHSHGIVHGDIKVQNILVFPPVDRCGCPEVKVADFGLAREAGCTIRPHKGEDEDEDEDEDKDGEEHRGFEWRGTPLYMSPEAVNDNEYEAPSDVWALGCAVVEMATGRPAWSHPDGANVYSLMIRIGLGDETPIIPHDLSEEGKDFLRKCFVRDPTKRWTAEMLLNHPFVACKKDCQFVSPPHSPSPRTHFDFTDWNSSIQSSTISTQSSLVTSPREFWQGKSEFGSFNNYDHHGSDSPIERIHNLACDTRPDFEDSESLWITVR